MGRRVYEAGFDTQPLGSVLDIWSILAPATKGIQLHWFQLSAAGVTTAAEVRLRLKRGTATVTQGTGGTIPSINIVDAGDTLAGTAVVHANDTAAATTSGNFTGFLKYFQWNVLLPWDYMPGPEDEDRPTCLVAQAFVLDMPSAPAAVSASGFVQWREVP